MKKIFLVLALICMMVLPVFGQTGNYTVNEYFYLPLPGAYGLIEYNEYNKYMQIADYQIELNKTAGGNENIQDVVGAMVSDNTETFIDLQYQDTDGTMDAVVPVKDEDNMVSNSANHLSTQQSIKSYVDALHALQYLKTDIDELSEVETIYTKDIIDSDELAALKFTDLADTPAAYDNGKYAKSTVDGLVWDTPAGYTNLTSFVDQTAWRLFYSNNLGDVIELALGTDGQYLKSTGATSAPIFDDPAGAGDMLKATYDTDSDNDIDVAAGGTEKSSWTLYCIPYLSGTTAFGEIPIGTDNYALTVNGATGYDWTHLQVYDAGLLSLAGLTYVSDSFIKVTATDTYEIRTIAEMKTDLAYMTDLVDDTTPEYGGPMDHNNERDTEVKTIEFNGLYDNGNSGATPTINWQNGNYQKIAISENALLTFSNAFIGTITLVMTYSGNYTLGFNAGYTILEEGGTELSFTETSAAVDILKVMYLGTANNYVVGLMADVKD